MFFPILLDLVLINGLLQRCEKETCCVWLTKEGNINTHFSPNDWYGSSKFSSAYNISVSAHYNAALPMTIRPNNNIMESVKHTLGHTNNIPLTDCFVSQNKHIGRIVIEIIAKMDQKRTERKKRAEKRPDLFLAQSNWAIHRLYTLCGISSCWGNSWSEPCANGLCLSLMALFCNKC